MRRRLDPAVAAELDAVDAALAGTRPDAAIAAIAAAARADATPMSPAFAARLQEAVRTGFPAAAAPAGPRRRAPRPRALAAAGAIAAALAAIVVAASALHGGAGPAPEHVASGAASSAGAAVRGGPSPALATAGTRRVQRTAELTIATPVGRLQDTADSVAATADRVGGFVARSDASVTGNGGQATFDLRIPASRLDEALAAISRLGHVRSRSQQSLDVTGAYDTARARLRDAQAERSALLRALAGATTQPQIDSLQARLRIVRGQIAAAGRALDRARRASAQAQVSVTVLGVARAGAAVHPGHRWTPGRALHDAVGVLSALLGVLIVALAGALPIAMLAAGAAIAGRALRRRRRERALGSSSAAV